jgi:quinohemoprotein ethanol dehydrogenase
VIWAAPSAGGGSSVRATVFHGKRLYQAYCFYCHGDTAVSGGVVPDLRYSPTLAAADAWKAIVLDGSLTTIRAYVVQRAHDEKKRLADP